MASGGSRVNGEVILVVDDDVDDVFFITHALTKAQLAVQVRHAINGNEAISYIQQSLTVPGGVHPMPRVVLLDIKMPGLNGFDVLNWIRSQPELANLPLVVLSSSEHPDDISKATQLGADLYVVKHSLFSDLPLQLQPLLTRKTPAEVQNVQQGPNPQRHL